MPAEKYTVNIIKLLKNHPSTTPLACHSNSFTFSGSCSRHRIIPFQDFTIFDAILLPRVPIISKIFRWKID
jgi:hypothetical protein